MSLPDPATVRSEPTPDGFHYEWVPEAVNGVLAWRILRPSDVKQQCRWTDQRERCPNKSVAKLQRSRGPREQWWHYCAMHMFGRQIDGQRVWVIHMVPDIPELDR